MNCIARLTTCLVCCAIVPACYSPDSIAEPAVRPLTYRLDYEFRPEPTAGLVHAMATLTQPRALLREVSFPASPRVTGLEGDGQLDREDGVWHWRPPAEGGALHWTVSVPHRRNGSGFDAWLGAEWGVFRAEDLIPRAASRTLKGARSETWMRFSLPHGWSVVTEYPKRDGRFRVDKPGRRFDQPGGWIVVGHLGVRRETIAGVRVAVAAPVGQSVRRMDILAMLNWTLPELSRLVPDLPGRITIVSAGDPMWRGGLSAPRSLYLHADRPLISENATSTLVHEVMHLALGIDAAEGYDWISEGLAEYYSLELLQRSGTISNSRYERARADLAEWAKQAEELCRHNSSGPVTAKAVTVFERLNREMRRVSDGAANLDDLVQALVSRQGKADLATLRDMAESLAGHELESLRPDRLPGCGAADSATARS